MKKSPKPPRAHNFYLAALAASLLFFPGSRTRAAESSSRSSIEAKLALESSLEKRIQMVLSEALGTGDIIVIISAELQEEQKNQARDFLPGIPEKEKVGEISLSSSLTMIKKISATLILDRNLPDSDIKLGKKLAAGLLGLPPEREDLITVEKMDFRKARPFSPADLLVPPNLWSLIWILLAAVLGALVVFAFFKPFAAGVRDLVSALGARTTSAEDKGPAPERPQAAAAETKSEEKKPSLWLEPPRKSPFWFLTPENAANLAFILRSKPVEDMTIILSYAPEAVASILIEALYPKSIEALAGLPKVTLMPQARIKGLETELFAALDYVVGGETKTMNIMEQLPEEIQEKAVASLSVQNPAFSARLSAELVRFSDIKNLEDAHAQILARRIPIRNLALALKNSDLAQIFIKKLSEGMQERFLQEMELTRNPSPEARRAERMRIAQEIRKMHKEGLIVLAKTSPVPAATTQPAAKPPAQNQNLQAAAKAPAQTTNIQGEAKPSAQTPVIPEAAKSPVPPAAEKKI